MYCLKKKHSNAECKARSELHGLEPLSKHREKHHLVVIYKYDLTLQTSD